MTRQQSTLEGRGSQVAVIQERRTEARVEEATGIEQIWQIMTAQTRLKNININSFRVYCK